MVYLLLCSLVLFIGIARMHTHMLQMLQYESSTSAPRPIILAGLTGIFPALAFSLPVYVLFLDGEGSWTYDHNRIVVYVVLAASLIFLAQAGLGARSVLQGKKLGFWATGRIVVLLFAGIVGSISGIKHLTFFSSSQDGFANVGMIREIADLSDMKACTSSIALVQFRDAGPITYRCPSLLMFGRDTQQPFIPWPDYVEGSSQNLADAIGIVKDAAEHERSVRKLEH